MEQKTLDRLAEQAVSGLKGFFAQRVNAGEDPTTCLQSFLSFLESNKHNNQQFLRMIASRIDSSFFSPLNKVSQVACPDDLITAYHDLVTQLLEVDPQMPYGADHQRLRGLIEKAQNRVNDRLSREKSEKRRTVEDSYSTILLERKKDYGRDGPGRTLKIAWICSFILFGILLVSGLLLELPGFFIVVGALIGGVIALGIGTGDSETNPVALWLVGALLGGGAGHLVSLLLQAAGLYLMFFCLALGIVLLVIYRGKIGGLQLTSQERCAFSTSLNTIEKHFAERGEYETAQAVSSVILASDDATASSDGAETMVERISDSAMEEQAR